MKKTRIIIGVIALIIIIIGSYLLFFREKNQKYSLAKVSRANVVQEVSETGAVKIGEKISLSFKNAGQIEKIIAEVGDEVKEGQDLAELNNTEIALQLREAEAGLRIIQAEKLNTEVSLETARQNLEDVKKIADEQLKNAYQSAIANLEDYYLKAYNSSILVGLIKRNYFERGDLEGIIIADNKAIIDTAIEEIKYLRDLVIALPRNENVDTAISRSKDSLFKIINSLQAIGEMIETSAYHDIVSTADKTLLDNQKTYVNTAYSSVISTQENISSVKTNNTANINNAEQLVREIENKLNNQINGLFYSKIQQAEARVSLLQNQIQESILKSPAEGKIISINKKAGEFVQTGESAMVFMPENLFQIKADIYEEDIVMVKIGNPVEIKLTAFSDRFFNGKVIAIEPAEKLIEGVVYYELTIDFDEALSEIKTGMTADITIKTDVKENVLSVSTSAIEKRDGKAFVQVLKGGQAEERQIEIGLEGSNDLTEVISGLEEGEEVILR